jgi:hypothetical protein
MFPRRSLIRAAGFVAPVALAALVGCGSKGGSFATVSGVVTHNGAPVDGAKIIFHSTVEVEGKQGAAYGAMTDSSGKYVIASVGKDPGIPPGLYKVTIVKLEGKGVTPQEGIDAGQLDAMASDTGGTTKSGGPINLLPKEYAALGSSKLSVTLEAGKNEGKDFNLTGK